VAMIVEKMKAYRILVSKYLGIRTLERPRKRWEDILRSWVVKVRGVS